MTDESPASPPPDDLADDDERAPELAGDGERLVEDGERLVEDGERLVEDRERPDPEQELARLKALLGADKDAELAALRDRLDDPEQFAQAVERVLPRAVSLRTQRDEKLSSALYPTVERAMQTSVKRNPKVLIDVIFPVMGPAIRKAIREAIAGLVTTINRNVEYTFTPRGLKWRLEAWRTKKSLGEVILAKSHVFKVEQVFLVHAETGLMLAHVTTPEFDAEDKADLVSSMMTALKDFARDSFDVKEGDDLSEFRVGDHVVFAERGPHAILAAVSIGDGSPELRETMQVALETIHREQASMLADFEGDVGPFEIVRPELETCLMHERREIKRNVMIPFLLATAAVGLLLWFAIGFFNDWRFEQRWTDYIEKLRSEPGLIIVDERHEGRRGTIVGLRDRNARDPSRFFEGTGLTAEDVEATWYEFQSPHGEFVARRVRAYLGLTEGEEPTVRVESGVLFIEGRSNEVDLVKRAPPVPALFAGVESVDVTGLTDEGSEGLARHAARIEAVRVTFDAGQSLPDQRQRDAIARLIELLGQLDEGAEFGWYDVEVTVVGHAHAEGAADPNSLSERRATAVLADLAKEPWRVVTFAAARGVGTREPLPAAEAGADGAANRRVSCVVKLTRRSSPR